MRFFKLRYNFNWKYVIGELLLIFVGINLAIWFNDWNTNKKVLRDKAIVLEKIKEEIESNRAELSIARKNNIKIRTAFSEYSKLYDGNTSEIVSSPDDLATLQIKFPGYYKVLDSTEVKPGLFQYKGQTHIELELIELTEIAWETTRSVNITNKIDYECLYELESMYSLQRRVQNEINNAANALQKGELKELMSILKFADQLDTRLMENYQSMLEIIDNCR